jgi:hypothetical protein
MNDEIQMFAPTGDDIKGTLETVQAAARASFHDGGKEFRHTGSSTEFHDSMLTKCIDGVPLFVDSSGDEWLLHHLIPDETPLSAGALELLNAEYQIGVTLEAARLLDTETKSLLKWMSNAPPCDGLPDLIRDLEQSYAAAKAISISVIARELAAREVAEQV